MAERVLLVSMPFGGLERPAISLGLLKAHCRRLDIPCDVAYLTFDFADAIGLDDYLWICSDDVPYTAFAGEWVFAEALYGPRPDVDAAYIDEVLRRTWRFTDGDVKRLLRIRGQVEPYLAACLTKLAWADYTFVGFTSVFQQNLPSLVLSSRVKRAHPETTIAFGGANWEEGMGVALQGAFPFVDLVFSGEADQSFPAVLAARRDGTSLRSIAGVTTREGTAAVSAGRVQDLNDVPVPDFDDFFIQKEASEAVVVEPTLLVETARGCWWGERSHCTFCGLNGATMTFRSKRPQRVIEEVEALRTRYDTALFSVVDDIIDMSFFDTVLPRLAEEQLGLEMFWEVKANLSVDQVRALRDAGVTMIQPGIEALNDHVLKLMRKGTTMFRNIELLKWCRELGVRPYWNLLYGFPGETQEDYRQTEELIPAIWHLEPPTACGPIRLDRFSPYYDNAADFGMTDVRPMAPFTYLYPFAPETVMNIAYYFDFDYADKRKPDEFAGKAIALANSWQAQTRRGNLELTAQPGNELQILDTRGDLATRPRRAILNGWKASVYAACDRSMSLYRLRELPAVIDCAVTEAELLEFLRRCVHHRLMITNGKRWLAVAVWRERDRRRWSEATAAEMAAALS